MPEASGITYREILAQLVVLKGANALLRSIADRFPLDDHPALRDMKAAQFKIELVLQRLYPALLWHVEAEEND